MQCRLRSWVKYKVCMLFFLTLFLHFSYVERLVAETHKMAETMHFHSRTYLLRFSLVKNFVWSSFSRNVTVHSRLKGHLCLNIFLTVEGRHNRRRYHTLFINQLARIFLGCVFEADAVDYLPRGPFFSTNY